MEFAREYGDRIIGLAHGRIIFDGPPTALRQHELDQIYAHESKRHNHSSMGRRSLTCPHTADIATVRGEAK